MKMRHEVIMMSVVIFLMSGCATDSGGLTEREGGALLGGGIGAGTGAIIGHQTGHAGAGTAIGAGAGALTGALVGEGMRRNKEQAKQELRQESGVTSYSQTGEIHTKYNPRSGQTFPESYTFDPNTGEKLEYIKR